MPTSNPARLAVCNPPVHALCTPVCRRTRLSCRAWQAPCSRLRSALQDASWPWLHARRTAPHACRCVTTHAAQNPLRCTYRCASNTAPRPRPADAHSPCVMQVQEESAASQEGWAEAASWELDAEVEHLAWAHPEFGRVLAAATSSGTTYVWGQGGGASTSGSGGDGDDIDAAGGYQLLAALYPGPHAARQACRDMRLDAGGLQGRATPRTAPTLALPVCHCLPRCCFAPAGILRLPRDKRGWCWPSCSTAVSTCTRRRTRCCRSTGHCTAGCRQGRARAHRARAAAAECLCTVCTCTLPCGTCPRRRHRTGRVPPTHRLANAHAACAPKVLCLLTAIPA